MSTAGSLTLRRITTKDCMEYTGKSLIHKPLPFPSLSPVCPETGMDTAGPSAPDSPKPVPFKLSDALIHGSCSEIHGLQIALEMTHYKIENSPWYCTY